MYNNELHKKMMSKSSAFKKDFFSGKTIVNKKVVKPLSPQKRLALQTDSLENNPQKENYKCSFNELFERFSGDKNAYQRIHEIISRYLSDLFCSIPCVANGILIKTLPSDWEETLELYCQSINE